MVKWGGVLARKHYGKTAGISPRGKLKGSTMAILPHPAPSPVAARFAIKHWCFIISQGNEWLLEYDASEAMAAPILDHWDRSKVVLWQALIHPNAIKQYAL